MNNKQIFLINSTYTFVIMNNNIEGLSKDTLDVIISEITNKIDDKDISYNEDTQELIIKSNKVKIFTIPENGKDGDVLTLSIKDDRYDITWKTNNGTSQDVDLSNYYNKQEVNDLISWFEG